jgi:hypothetical protein
MTPLEYDNFLVCAKDSVCVAPWHLPNQPYTIKNCVHVPEKFHT